MQPLILSEEFIAKAKKIKVVIFDVDGVFTNGKIYVDDDGKEIKAFHVLDGQGIKFLQQTGVEIAIISGRDAPGVAFRMRQLGIQHIFLGHRQKTIIYEQLLALLHVTDQEVAYVGDDWPDAPILQRVGLPITVPNAIDEMAMFAAWVTRAKGGKGAVREVCEYLMKAQQTWDKVIQLYFTGAP